MMQKNWEDKSRLVLLIIEDAIVDYKFNKGVNVIAANSSNFYIWIPSWFLSIGCTNSKNNDNITW